MILTKKNNNSYYSLIENATFVDTEYVSTNTIPVIESEDRYLIPFNNIYELSESTMKDYEDIIHAISEDHKIPIDSITVSIKEEDIILDPSLIDNFDSYVIESIGEQSFPYAYCALLAESYLESGDETYLNILCEDEIVELDEASKINKMGAKWYGWAKRHPKLATAVTPTKANLIQSGINTVAGPLGILTFPVSTVYGIKQNIQMYKHLKKEAEHKPKSWIAKKVASLRKVYQKWLDLAKVERYRGQAGLIKRAAAKLLEVIDYLLKKLQNTADGR